MAQGKGKELKGGPAQKHLHSRISYLYQAATYLADATKDQKEHTDRLKSTEQSNTDPGEHVQSSTITFASAETESREVPFEPGNEQGQIKLQSHSAPRNSALTRQLLAHLRAVSLKTVIRITPAMKQSICKRCDVLLVPGSTAITILENRSCDGKKPWADVLLLTCVACGAVKRFPVGAKRQLRRQYRPDGSKAKTT